MRSPFIINARGGHIFVLFFLFQIYIEKIEGVAEKGNQESHGNRKNDKILLHQSLPGANRQININQFGKNCGDEIFCEIIAN